MAAVTGPRGPSGDLKPVTVIYSAPFFPSIGGMEEFARNLAFGLHDLGCAVEVVTDTAAGAHDAEKPFPFVVHRTTALAEKAKLFARADVVIFAGVRLRETFMSLRIRKRLILTHHGTYVAKSQPRTLATGFAKRLVSRLFANVSVSRYIAAKIGGRQRVIHNCFDDGVFAEPKGSARPLASFVFCGRLVSQKGCALGLAAFAEVRRSNGAATLTVIGDGPEMATLVQLARTLGLGNSVTFTGALPAKEIGAQLRAHRCMIVPAIREEAFGIVVLEALASGCEVIASNRGGLPEALGNFGWVVTPTVENLATAMMRVSQGETRRGVGVADWLKAHTRESITRQYMQEIQRLLSS